MFTTEQMNRIVLMMAGLLLLLVFMDHQARRHYGLNSAFQPDRYSSVNVAEKIEQSLEPIRAPLEDVLNSPAENSLQEFATHNIAPDTKLKLRPVETSFVDLYFIKFNNSQQSEIVRVRRAMNGSEITINGLISMLQKGPSPDERGLLNMFDEGVRVHSAVLQNGIINLDVDNGMGRMGEHVIQDRIAQVALTLFQFPEVQGIRLFINGKRVNNLGNAKVSIPEILTMPKRKITLYP